MDNHTSEVERKLYLEGFDDGEKSSLASDKQIAMLKGIAFQAGIKTPYEWEDLLKKHFSLSPMKIPKDEVNNIKDFLESGEIIK